ncbi:MAG TPA: EAL domain-containing protein, partial [Mycobacteriales bacterium]|nr:EAL domain-containing protein [Mycobacteriales bacterium]
ANGLGVGCVAEGVERPEQLEVLSQLGCKSGQGFLLGKPVAREELPTAGRASGSDVARAPRHE